MNKQKEEILRKVWTNPKTGLGSARDLYLKVKDKGFTYKKVKEWLEKQELHQLYKRPKKVYHPIIASTDHDYQIDLMFLSQYKYQNRGYHIILTCINVTSRYAHCIPMKGKSKEKVLEAFTQFLSQVGFSCQQH